MPSRNPSLSVGSHAFLRKPDLVSNYSTRWWAAEQREAVSIKSVPILAFWQRETGFATAKPEAGRIEPWELEHLRYIVSAIPHDRTQRIEESLGGLLLHDKPSGELVSAGTHHS